MKQDVHEHVTNFEVGLSVFSGAVFRKNDTLAASISFGSTESGKVSDLNIEFSSTTIKKGQTTTDVTITGNFDLILNLNGLGFGSVNTSLLLDGSTINNGENTFFCLFCKDQLENYREILSKTIALSAGTYTVKAQASASPTISFEKEFTVREEVPEPQIST